MIWRGLAACLAAAMPEKADQAWTKPRPRTAGAVSMPAAA